MTWRIRKQWNVYQICTELTDCDAAATYLPCAKLRIHVFQGKRNSREEERKTNSYRSEDENHEKCHHFSQYQTTSALGLCQQPQRSLQSSCSPPEQLRWCAAQGCRMCRPRGGTDRQGWHRHSDEMIEQRGTTACHPGEQVPDC